MSNFMALPAEPLPAPVQAGVGRVGWSDLFVDSEARTEEWRLVLVWAPWCTHCGEAFRELQGGGGGVAGGEREGVAVRGGRAEQPAGRRADDDAVGGDCGAGTSDEERERLGIRRRKSVTDGAFVRR